MKLYEIHQQVPCTKVQMQISALESWLPTQEPRNEEPEGEWKLYTWISHSVWEFACQSTCTPSAHPFDFCPKKWTQFISSIEKICGVKGQRPSWCKKAHPSLVPFHAKPTVRASAKFQFGRFYLNLWFLGLPCITHLKPPKSATVLLRCKFGHSPFFWSSFICFYYL